MDYLVVPRLLATTLALPLLTVESIALGIGAGYWVGVRLLTGIDPTYLWDNMLKYTDNIDLFFGMTKAFVYGGIIALVGCYKGLTCGMGAEGVGRATTEAVVYSSIAILITNFFLTLVLQRIAVMDVMIEVRALKEEVRVRKQTILDGVDLCIETGESAAIIGRSGGGKSVLLKHMIGLLQPDEGEVLVGFPAKTSRTHDRTAACCGCARSSAWSLRARRCFDSMTVEENVAFPAAPQAQLYHRRAETGKTGVRRAGHGGFAGHAEKEAGGTLRRHAQARRPGAGDHLRAANRPVATSRPRGWTRSCPTASTSSSSGCATS